MMKLTLILSAFAWIVLTGGALLVARLPYPLVLKAAALALFVVVIAEVFARVVVRTVRDKELD